MTPGERWARPAQGARFGWAALVSLALHGASLASLIWLFNRAPREEPVPERGVEIVWDEAMEEAVSSADTPDAPGAPPDVSAPQQAEAPPPPAEPPAPPAPPVAMPPLAMPPVAPPPSVMVPPPPAPVPPPQAVAQAPVIPPLDLAPRELPMPDLSVAPPPDPPAEPPTETPREVQQAQAATPPPVPEPPLPEPPPPEPPPPEPARAPPPRPRPTPPPRPAQPRTQPPTEASRPGQEAAPQATAGIGRATGAVVPPGPDTRYQNAAPSYPEAARLRGEQGTVGLELAIGTDGKVITVNVARSSGSPMLDAAARRAVQDWRFRPAMRDGEAVPGTIRTSVHFRLQ